jgi:hypothetical protein
MNRSLLGFLIDNNIEGDVNHPPEPIYVRAEGSTYLEPDIMYLSTELRQQMEYQRTLSLSVSVAKRAFTIVQPKQTLILRSGSKPSRVCWRDIEFSRRSV